MNCTEMTFDGGEHFVVYYVKQLHIETTFCLGCRSDILGILSTAEEHMELLIFVSDIEWTNCGISTWERELEASDLVESGWMQKLACSVSAAREKHGEIVSNSDRKNFIALDVPDESRLAVFEIIVDESTLVRGIVNGLVKSSPLNVVNNMVFWCFDFLDRLWTSLFVTPCQSVLQIIYSQDTLRVLVFENNGELFIAV